MRLRDILLLSYATTRCLQESQELLGLSETSRARDLELVARSERAISQSFAKMRLSNPPNGEG